MTCHSGAGPDVYRCPVPTAQLISQSHSLGSHVTRHAHSLSMATAAVVVAAAVLPDGGCGALTHTVQAEGSRAFIYLSSPPAILAVPTQDTVQHRHRGRHHRRHRHPSPSHCPPAPLPFAMWKRPFSCGDLRGSRPDA